MPVARDARGRFASSHEKTPVTTVEEAAETLRHFTTIMNEVARANNLCSQFGISVTRAVSDTPGAKFETPNDPEYAMTYSIRGSVLTPVGADITGPNRDYRRENATRFLRDEFQAWATEHDLDPMKGSSWLAWVDTLPEERKRPHGQTNVLGETGTAAYADPTEAAARIVTFALPSDPVPPPPPGLESADPEIRPFQVGDRVIRVSDTHTVYGSTYDYAMESDRGMTAVIRTVSGSGDVSVAWDDPKGTSTSRIDSTCLRHFLPAAQPGKAPDDTPEVTRPGERTFEVGDRVLVLPDAHRRGGETDNRYGVAFDSWTWDEDLYAEVIGVAFHGEGYRVRSINGPPRMVQTVATVDLRPHVDATQELDRLTPVPF